MVDNMIDNKMKALMVAAMAVSAEVAGMQAEDQLGIAEGGDPVNLGSAYHAQANELREIHGEMQVVMRG